MDTKHEVWGILGAMELEVALLREQMSVARSESALGTTFFFGTLCGKKVVVACCGIGKVNAAACATWMLFSAGCTRLIHVGIAGAVGKGLKTLDVVLSRELCFHDQDAVMLKYFPKRRFFAGDPELLALCREACARPGVLRGALREGRIATGDRFVADRALRDAIVADCAPDCVEMEGAAIAHVAFAAGVPCLVIRTMSDCADEEAAETYDHFMEDAAQQSAHIVLAMLSVAPKPKRSFPVGPGLGVFALAAGLLATFVLSGFAPKPPEPPRSAFARVAESLPERPATAEVCAAAETAFCVRLTAQDVDAWRVLAATGDGARALKTVVDYRRAAGETR